MNNMLIFKNIRYLKKFSLIKNFRKKLKFLKKYLKDYILVTELN